jgi:trehalose utilization protein
MDLISRLTLALPLIVVAAIGQAQEKSIRIAVWDERQPKQQLMYENFLGNHIAKYLSKQNGFSVRSVGMDDPEQGLPDTLLDNCDVLIWWGHVRQDEISIETAQRIVDRIKAGKLSFIVLHSAHWATPFVVAMEERAKQDALARLSAADRRKARIELTGKFEREPPKHNDKLTPSVSYEKSQDGSTLIRIVRPNCCFPDYAAHGKPSKLKTLLPNHPIAKGIAKEFTISQTEMYNEPFHVPAPDAVVFEETWEAGHRFRSGAVWSLGKGKVFYFRPGHENFTVFHQPEPLKIVANAARWLGTAIAQDKDKPITLDNEPNLVGFWKFDEASGKTAADSSKYGRKGLLKGGLSFDKHSVSGRTGKALRLNGDEHYIQITKYKGVTGTKTRTVATWIKTMTDDGEIISWGSDDYGQMWIFGFIRGSIGVTPNGGYLYINDEVQDNEWHHVAAVVEEAELPNLHDNVKLYKDGILADIHDIGLLDLWPIQTGSDLEVTIGREFKGLIDDVRIYDRALTEKQIKAIFSLRTNRPLK